MSNIRSIGAASVAPNHYLTPAQIERALEDIVITNYWEDDKDKGRSRMLIDVFRHTALCAALEDYSQAMCDIPWKGVYKSIGLSLHYESRIINPSHSVGRDMALRELVENQIRIAQDVSNALITKFEEHINEAVERYEAEARGDYDE